MDALSQTLTGAVFAQAALGRRLGRAAALFGGAGGVLADVDILFDGWSDPALPFLLHRHFTHALVFVPAGGLVAAAPFLLVRRWREQAGWVLAATTIGYATHGLLDQCTSYGTHLLWPFFDGRTAWDAMSIIDPIYTLLLLFGVLASLLAGRAGPARAALAAGLLYVAFGFLQHHRAATVQASLAAARGHVVEHARVMPTLGNLIVWRSVYRAGGAVHADAVRVPWLGAATLRPGTSTPVMVGADLPAGAPSRVRHVFDEFRRFADGFVAVAPVPGEGIVVGDMRYSFDTSAFAPIWGLRIDLAADDPVRFEGFGARGPARRAAVRALWREIGRGDDAGYVAPPGPEAQQSGAGQK